MLDIRFEPMGTRHDGRAQERMVVEGLEEPISREDITVYFADGKPKITDDPRRVIHYTGPRWEEVMRKMGLSEHVLELEVASTSIVIVWSRKPKGMLRTFYQNHFRYVAELADREFGVAQFTPKQAPRHKLRFTGREVLNLEGLPLRVTYFPGGCDAYGRKQAPTLSLA